MHLDRDARGALSGWSNGCVLGQPVTGEASALLEVSVDVEDDRLEVSVDELEVSVEPLLAASDVEVAALVEAGDSSEALTDSSALDVDWLDEEVSGSLGVGSAAVVVVVVFV